MAQGQSCLLLSAEHHALASPHAVHRGFVACSRAIGSAWRRRCTASSICEPRPQTSRSRKSRRWFRQSPVSSVRIQAQPGKRGQHSRRPHLCSHASLISPLAWLRLDTSAADWRLSEPPSTLPRSRSSRTRLANGGTCAPRRRRAPRKQRRCPGLRPGRLAPAAGRSCYGPQAPSHVGQCFIGLMLRLDHGAASARHALQRLRHAVPLALERPDVVSLQGQASLCHLLSTPTQASPRTQPPRRGRGDGMGLGAEDHVGDQLSLTT